MALSGSCDILFHVTNSEDHSTIPDNHDDHAPFIVLSELFEVLWQACYWIAYWLYSVEIWIISREIP